MVTPSNAPANKNMLKSMWYAKFCSQALIPNQAGIESRAEIISKRSVSLENDESGNDNHGTEKGPGFITGI